MMRRVNEPNDAPAVALGSLAIAVMTLRFASTMQAAGDTLRSLGWTYTAYAAVLTIGGLAIFPTIDRWQDLPAEPRGHVSLRNRNHRSRRYCQNDP